MVSSARWAFETAAVRALPDLALVSVRGEDALRWLNGQLTCDLRELPEGACRYGLVLNAKGRIIADARVIGGDPIGLEVPAATWAELKEHFEKYIIMEDVELEQTSLSIVTVQGPRASEIVRAAGLAAIDCDRLGAGGVDVLTDSPEQVVAQLDPPARDAGGGTLDTVAWEIARLRAQRPAFGPDFGPTTYPQEAGLEGVAVSFQKGCYLGQEVVCMLESRGQLTRRLVALEGQSTLTAGAPLTSDGAEVGQLTSAVQDGATWRALGYVKRAHAESGRELCTPAGIVRVAGVVGARV